MSDIEGLVGDSPSACGRGARSQDHNTLSPRSLVWNDGDEQPAWSALLSRCSSYCSKHQLATTKASVHTKTRICRHDAFKAAAALSLLSSTTPRCMLQHSARLWYSAGLYKLHHCFNDVTITAALDPPLFMSADRFSSVLPTAAFTVQVTQYYHRINP